MTQKVAIVTGGNRGIGRETCRQLGMKGYRVVLTARDAAKGNAAANELDSEIKRTGVGGDSPVLFRALDVADSESIDAFTRFIELELGRVDVLVNNAGIMLDSGGPEGSSAFKVPVDSLRKAMETNVYGPYRLCQRLAPLMKKNGYGRIVNLSSGMGQLSEMNGGYPSYRISKTALNAVTRIFADELEGTNVLVNSVCPGWVKTDMGGPGAERPVEKGAETVVWLATLPDGGPTGGFFRDREPIAW